MKMKLPFFRNIIEIVIVIMVMALLWNLGLRVGFPGGQGLKLAILPEPTTLLQILYAVIEFLIGIKFFIILSRQILPGGMKELVLGQMTFANKSRYFPGIFALGVFAGLTGHAGVVIMALLLYGKDI
jgi:hypothetical protein